MAEMLIWPNNEFENWVYIIDACKEVIGLYKTSMLKIVKPDWKGIRYFRYLFRCAKYLICHERWNIKYNVLNSQNIKTLVKI